MKLRRFVTISALLVGALAAGSTVAGAQPAESRDEIAYESHIEDRTVVTTIDAGAFAVASDGESVELRDSEGAPVLSLPLAYRLDDLQFPFDEEITDEGRTLRLTPKVEKADATPISEADRLDDDLALHDVASVEENTRAQTNFAQQLGMATAVGGLAGTVIGGTIGLVGLLAGPVALATVPTFAAVGAIAGTVIVGGPMLVIAGIQLAETLNAAPGTTMWAKQSTN
ncbi:MAG: ammonium transporter [Rhodococcus sp. (in: high G+C Gram-positive bacteria)]|uniref:ammonium transporter n=1 Tax=Rhodococcus sp. TaxID=1831 RepID=UPI003BAF1238